MIVKKKPSFLRRMIWWMIILGFFGALAVTALVSIFLLITPIPDPNTLREREVVESTKIFDRTGKTLLFEIYNEEKRTVIPFEEIPRSVKNATVAIEDSNFYNHPGISVFSIIRAFINDLMRGHLLVQGGSTITQQLVKNTLLTREKTITRKLKEAILALKIERMYTKDEILNMYLNEIPYGSNAYGIEAAAQTFFGKSARDLTHTEAAYLAALPKAPSYFSPYGTQVDELELRKNIVLKRMEELQFISSEEAASAREESVAFLQAATQGIRAPHFVMYVMDTLREQFGEEFIQKQGLIIQTTLDVSIQQRAQEVVTKYADTIEKNYNAGNTGLVAINPRTGEILAMVGSRNYFDRDREGNFNVAIARRQPGSAFKPLVYAAAFEKGYTPETIVFDVKTEFAAAGADSYRPQNYDNIFRGPITFREALAQSVNIAAVKVLYLTGLREALDMARRLGITTLAGPNQYGLTLVLGGGEVQLLELVSAYGVFANDGVRNEPIAILRIEKNNGDVLWEHSPRPQQALDQNIARMISHILSDNTARAPAFGSESALNITGREVAAKTGTTNNYRDAWIIGYTPSLAAGVWAGNNDNTPMEKRVAGFIVAPIWHDFMEQILQNIPQEQFTPPTPSDTKKPVLTGEWRGGRTYAIDSVSKKLASDLTPPELVKNQIIPEIHSILYWVDKTDPRGPIPEHPEHDSQFINWETGVRAWAEEKGVLSKENIVIPTEYDDVHTEKNKPRVSIQKPQPDELFGRDNLVSVTLSIQNTYQISQIDYFLNDEYVGSNTGSNRSFVINLNSLAPATKTADITVRVYDEVKNVGEAQVSIILSSA
ncbi:MAG: 1A family penicillin-binding protein [Parcubacteria group bacterium Gr01-1014_29]|nr:MAG: 1A family penicillin-binding protein [Parcubacteria group bacterium Gr01-1014_29]